MSGADTNSPTGGTLYLVATPIGNLHDLTFRAVEVLRSVSMVAAEDTRHTRQLLNAHGIQAQMISYREQNHSQAAARIIEQLAAGQDVALVSDAGTPGISDPGQALVADVLVAGHGVVPVPGACAAISALAGSGLPSDRFVFIGFLPRKPGAMHKQLEGLADEPGTLIFYESPQRVGRTLKSMAEVFGERQAVVVRELTKVHETFDRGSLLELAERYAAPTRGEVTLVVAGARKASPSGTPDELKSIVQALRSAEALSASDVVRLLKPLGLLSKRDLYRLAADAGDQEEMLDDD